MSLLNQLASLLLGNVENIARKSININYFEKQLMERRTGLAQTASLANTQHFQTGQRMQNELDGAAWRWFVSQFSALLQWVVGSYSISKKSEKKQCRLFQSQRPGASPGLYHSCKICTLFKVWVISSLNQTPKPQMYTSFNFHNSIILSS